MENKWSKPIVLALRTKSLEEKIAGVTEATGAHCPTNVAYMVGSKTYKGTAFSQSDVLHLYQDTNNTHFTVTDIMDLQGDLCRTAYTAIAGGPS